MNQDSAHSEQNSPVADTAETNQNQQNTQPDNTQEVKTSKSDSQPPKNSKLKLIIAVVVIALLGLIIFGLWKSYQPKPIELQGRVEAETVHVSTKVPSRIEEIYVQEGQKISKGQPLVRLVSPEIEAKKQQALATLQSALAFQSTVDRGSQQENIDTLYANWQSMKAQANLAKTTYQRGENLYRQGVISRQRRDEMLAAQTSAQELSEAAYQQYARAKRGSTSQQKSTADAQVEIAKAAVSEAQALEAETRLLAPISGTVSKTYGKPSELVAMGVPVVSILEDDDLWVSLNVGENQYASVYKNKTLEGFIPALNQSVMFKVKNIDAEGEFATIKTTRQTGGYDIRSFKLHLVPERPVKDLKVGMSVLFKIKEEK
ncbi:HlyD family secretion protein [Acinetobacter baumannii]|uniref:HlyD family secretion protein n=1 Tax=Acinetobacter baumannii TaxID=470 RepID=UPI0022A4FABE|nr:efflux RND transporter periplasmic adaptor subunit [Acinetobacter baumannii]HAV5575664.1 HlyD family secretion protein [Acinetobacter baumannii]HAV5597697.1 HlyD family secretion protein [Acinetobacter baumannii]HCU0567978.1 HlyD family secretion protein [Acinetobacter baumannii]